MATASRVLDVKPRVEAIGTGLGDDDRSKVAASLAEILGGTYRLLIKTHVHHWNVVGPLFYPVHVMTEAQYLDLFAATDVLAERIRALGHTAPVPEIARRNEKVGLVTMSVEQLVDDLVTDNEALVRMMREAAEQAEATHDHVTHDLLVARMTVHEKAIWMLRAIVAK